MRTGVYAYPLKLRRHYEALYDASVRRANSLEVKRND